MARYLVTGGCGFIGSHLVDALVAAGHQVVIVDNLSTGKKENVANAATLMIGDVVDAKLMRDAMRDADGCFHLAAIASVAKSIEDWPGSHRTNLTGAITVFDAACRARGGNPIPVIYASSAAVYGDSPKAPFSEGDKTRPISFYGADKLACELHARVAGAVFQLPNVGLRFFNVFGPRQDPRSPYSGVISIFFDRLVQQLPITVHGDGMQTRDFVYVGDVVDVMIAAMERADAAAPVFNVCTGHGTTVLDLAYSIAECIGVTPEITFASRRPGDIATSIGDRTRLIASFFPLSTSLAEGLKRVRDFFSSLTG